MYRHFLGSVFFKENWGNCSRQHVPRGNYKFKLKLPPGLAAVARLLRAACRHINGGPSEAGDCSHPPPKMATAENPTSGKATFDHVIGTGSLRFFACEQVLDIANPRYSNGPSSRGSLASQGTRIFQREAGDSIERGGWLTTKYF